MNILIPLIIVMVVSFLPLSNAVAEFEKEIKYNNGYGIYTIPYNMTNGEITKVEKSIPDCTVYLNVNVKDDDYLTIVIPNESESGELNSLFVIVNSVEVDFEESYDQSQRTLTIPIKTDTTQIGIIGIAMPEFSCPLPKIAKESKYYQLSPPKKQIENAILPIDVICKENLEKILRPSNNLPVCVNGETKTKLVERGWIN